MKEKSKPENELNQVRIRKMRLGLACVSFIKKASKLGSSLVMIEHLRTLQLAFFLLLDHQLIFNL